VTPGRVFRLRSPGSVWLLEAGELDIFFARDDRGEPAGALRHICRLSVGDAAFSLPPDSPPDLALFASPSPDARVNLLGELEVPADRLAELAARWRKAVGPPDAAPAGENLAEFHGRTIAALQRLQIAETQDEQRRLSARMEADGRAVDHALFTLSGSLASARGPALTEDAALPPLVRACQEIGRAAGIILNAPRSVLLGTAKDPQRAIARHSSVRTRRLVLKGEWWRQDSGPMLAFLEEGSEPVALLRRGGGYDFLNPADLSRTRINRTTAAKLSGIAYAFYRPFPNRAINWKDVLSVGLFGSTRDVATILITGVLASLLAVIAPFATGILFDTIIPGSERNQLLQCVALIVAAAVTTALIGLTRSYALLRLEGKMDFVTQAAVWDRLLNMPVTFFRGFSAGDLAYRSLAISQVRAILTGHTLTAILSGIFSVTTVFLLAWYSPMLALLGSAIAAATVAVTIGSSLAQLKYLHEAGRSAGAIASMVFEFIEGIAKFRVSGSEGRAFARWASAFAIQKRLFGSMRRLSNVLAVFSAVFPIAASGLIYYAVGAQMNKPGGGLSTGDFFAFNAAFSQLLVSVFGLNAGIAALVAAIPLYDRAKPIFQTAPENHADKSDPGDLRGGIEMNHASFRYGADSPLVLRDVSFSINPGEFVAFTGASGSGKSTLLRLLLGFEQPLSGAIYYDGQDFAGLDLQEVRRQMGVVLQSGKLLPGDILTNIIGTSPLTVDDAWEAARVAGIEEDIKTLPMGMYTMVAEGGKTLSGGQRQRLMIARAVVHRPRILLFDEATSALDNRTQDIVSRALNEMHATRIVVAHRLSTIVNANRIFVLDQGVIAESGTYDELLRRNGIFAELAKRQVA